MFKFVWHERDAQMFSVVPALLLGAVLGHTTEFRPWQGRIESRETLEQCGCPSRAWDAQELCLHHPHRHSEY